MVSYVLIFVLGFITALNASLFVFNVSKYKHSKESDKTPQISNSEVENSTDKNDNGNIYDFSKILGADVFDEYMNGGESERAR